MDEWRGIAGLGGDEPRDGRARVVDELVFAQPLLIVDLTEVALARIGQHGHDERLGIVGPARDV